MQIPSEINSPRESKDRGRPLILFFSPGRLGGRAAPQEAGVSTRETNPFGKIRHLMSEESACAVRILPVTRDPAWTSLLLTGSRWLAVRSVRRERTEGTFKRASFLSKQEELRGPGGTKDGTYAKRIWSSPCSCLAPFCWESSSVSRSSRWYDCFGSTKTLRRPCQATVPPPSPAKLSK